MTDAADRAEGSSRTPAPARGRKRRRITEDLSIQTEDGADVETINLPGESAPSPVAGPSHRSPTPSAALSGVIPPSPSPSVFELLSQPSEAYIELPSQPSDSFIDLTADPPPRPPTPPPVPSRAQPLAEYNCPICFCPPTRATLMPCGHVCCGECLFTAVKTTQRRNTYVVDPRTNTAKYVLSPVASVPDLTHSVALQVPCMSVRDQGLGWQGWGRDWPATDDRHGGLAPGKYFSCIFS
jgi:hypothetical protein